MSDALRQPKESDALGKIGTHQGKGERTKHKRVEEWITQQNQYAQHGGELAQESTTRQREGSQVVALVGQRWRSKYCLFI